MVRLRPRAAAATAATIITPFLLSTTDAFLHPAHLTAQQSNIVTPQQPAPVLQRSAFSRHYCGTNSPQTVCYSRPPSSSSRVSRLHDAAASAAARVESTPTMSIASENLDVFVTLLEGSRSSSSSVTGSRSSSSSSRSGRSSSGAKLTIRTSYLDPDTGTRRSWTTNRWEKDFFALGVTLMRQLGGSTADVRVPGPPREGSPPAVFEIYLRRLLGVPEVTSLPALYDFLDVPPDLVQEPVLFGEVVDDDDLFGVGRGGKAKSFRSADPNDPRTASSSYSARNNNLGGGTSSSNKSGATVAGAVVGGIMGGPVGAAIGAVAARAASGRDDGVGNVAKGAGAVADAAMLKAQAIEREFELSRKAKDAAGSAKKAVQKVDTDYSVRRRAGEAARKTARVARQTSKDLRVVERASGAAKATEKAARRAAEAAKKAEKEHRLRERAGNAFRRVGAKVKRSVQKLEERRKRGDADGNKDR